MRQAPGPWETAMLERIKRQTPTRTDLRTKDINARVITVILTRLLNKELVRKSGGNNWTGRYYITPKGETALHAYYRYRNLISGTNI